MIEQVDIELQTKRRGCHLVTNEIVSKLPPLPEVGMLNLFVQHTSCALSINENCDPDVRKDLSDLRDSVAPEDTTRYRHSDEGEDDMPAHCKSTLVGVSLNIPIRRGRLALGTWQGIYLCEFRNYGGPRRVVATVWS